MAAAVPWWDELIREIADYPCVGARYRDISPLLGSPAGFGRAVDDLVSRFDDVRVDRVAGIESRGFILAAPVAYRLRAGFVPVRKAGRLPWAVAREEYLAPTGPDKLEVHRDAIHPDESVVIVDDVLATGATAEATARLVEALGGRVLGIGCLLELPEFAGRERLSRWRVESLVAR